MTSRRPTASPVTGTARTVLAVAVGAAVLLPALSGCAVAARVLTTVQVVEALAEFAERAERPGTTRIVDASLDSPPSATVSGTGGSTT